MQAPWPLRVVSSGAAASATTCKQAGLHAKSTGALCPILAACSADARWSVCSALCQAAPTWMRRWRCFSRMVCQHGFVSAMRPSRAAKVAEQHRPATDSARPASPQCAAPPQQPSPEALLVPRSRGRGARQHEPCRGAGIHHAALRRGGRRLPGQRRAGEAAARARGAGRGARRRRRRLERQQRERQQRKRRQRRPRRECQRRERGRRGARRRGARGATPSSSTLCMQRCASRLGEEQQLCGCCSVHDEAGLAAGLCLAA
jgi:hypothetical protein